MPEGVSHFFCENPNKCSVIPWKRDKVVRLFRLARQLEIYFMLEVEVVIDVNIFKTEHCLSRLL